MHLVLVNCFGMSLLRNSVVRFPTRPQLFTVNVKQQNNINQSTEGAGGLGIIRGNKVGESQ